MTNPYQAPGAIPPPWTPQRDKASMDGALNGEYDFDIQEVLREAWEKSDGAKGAFWGAFVALFIAAIVGSMVQKALLGNSPSSQLFGGVLLLPLTGPLFMGIARMGIRRGADLPVAAGDVFHFLNPYNVNLVITQVLVYLATVAGFVLLVLPGFYLATSYLFAAMLVADKGLQPWEAMEISRKSVGHQWWKVFGFLFTMALLGIAACIPLFIGLIWVLPTQVIAMGVLYRKIFGATPEAVL